MMTIETLVLRIDECFPEFRAHLIIGHGHAVLAEELTDHLTVSAVYL